MHFIGVIAFISVQSLSRVQPCNPMDSSTPGFPVHHHLSELAQTYGSYTGRQGDRGIIKVPSDAKCLWVQVLRQKKHKSLQSF